MNSLPSISYVFNAPIDQLGQEDETLHTSVEPIDDTRVIPESFLILVDVAEAAWKKEEKKGTPSVTRRKRPWTSEEDRVLLAYAESVQHNFSSIGAAKYLKRHSCKRNKKQCQDRYVNYLHPDLSHKAMSRKEKDWIYDHYKKLVEKGEEKPFKTLQKDLMGRFKVLRSLTRIKNFIYSARHAESRLLGSDS